MIQVPGVIIGENNILGSRGYDIVSGNYNSKSVILNYSGDITDIHIGDKMSLKFGTASHTFQDFGVVTSIDNVTKTITFSEMPSSASDRKQYNEDGSMILSGSWKRLYSVYKSIGNKVQGNYSLIVGGDNVVENAVYSISQGWGNKNEGSYAATFGKFNRSGWGSLTSGDFNYAPGAASIAMGRGNGAIGSNSISLGGAAYTSESSIEEKTIQVHANDIIEYDPSSGDWTILEDYTGPIFGYLTSSTLNSLRIYDPHHSYEMMLFLQLDKNMSDRYIVKISSVVSPSGIDEIKYPKLTSNDNIVKHDDAFCWNGSSVGQMWAYSNNYYSNGKGTFNINPVNGERGFFIGKKSINTIIDEHISQSSMGVKDDITIDWFEDLFDDDYSLFELTDGTEIRLGKSESSEFCIMNPDGMTYTFNNLPNGVTKDNIKFIKKLASNIT